MLKGEKTRQVLREKLDCGAGALNLWVLLATRRRRRRNRLGVVGRNCLQPRVCMLW